MQITTKSASPEKLRVGTLAVGAFADGTLSAAAQAIDKASRRRLSAVLKRGDLETAAGATLLLHDLPASRRPGCCSSVSSRAERSAMRRFARHSVGVARPS